MESCIKKHKVMQTITWLSCDGMMLIFDLKPRSSSAHKSGTSSRCGAHITLFAKIGLNQITNKQKNVVTHVIV